MAGTLTADEMRLLAELQSSAKFTTPCLPKGCKRCIEQFVLDYGWWYAPCSLPQGVPNGAPHECFANAHSLATDNATFVYCEGYVIGNGRMPIKHAWVTDGNGSAIDNTLTEPGRAYAGVPFQIPLLLERAVKYHAVICVLDDWEHEWPLLGDFGDRPDEWLEPKGYGLTRIAGEAHRHDGKV